MTHRSKHPDLNIPRISTLYGGPQVSRQKKKAPGKREIPAAKEIFLRQKRNSRGNRKISR